MAECSRTIVDTPSDGVVLHSAISSIIHAAPCSDVTTDATVSPRSLIISTPTEETLACSGTNRIGRVYA